MRPTGDAGLQRAAWFVVVLGLCVGAVGVWPEGAPGISGSVLAALFDDRWMVGIVRLAVLLAGLYIAVSILVRSWEGVWLKSFGPASTAVTRSVRPGGREQAAGTSARPGGR